MLLIKEWVDELAPLLRYAKRKQGDRGRVLIRDAPALALQAGDRLEPGPTLRDVGPFEQLFDGDQPGPVCITFWRRGDETLARHKNPVFNKETG